MSRWPDREAMRTRILNVADRMFYAEGLRAVGVDAIAAEIGISKRTLYNHFPSKDALILAYLRRRFVPLEASDAPPADQILGIFSELERSLSAPSFRGCPFVNAVTELAEPDHEANQLATAFKEQRRRWFRDLASQLAVVDAEAVATQLLLLLDGAIAWALVHRTASGVRAARAAAGVLLTAASASPPRQFKATPSRGTLGRQ